MNQPSNHRSAGFSIVEMLVVILVIAVLTAITIISYTGSRKYSADSQAKIIIDVLDEARQKALNQRKTYRVEINETRGQVRLIDEGRDATTANDDVEVRRYSISPDVVVGAAPPNVTGAPTASSPIPVATFSTSSYPLSNGDSKITLRFRRNGQVVDAGTDNVGTGSVMSGATIYVRSRTPSVNAPDVIRAVTVLGTTGDTSLFKCRFSGSSCGSWSR